MRIATVIVVLLAGLAGAWGLDTQLGWQELPADTPVASKLHDERFRGAGETALQTLVEARASIGAPALTAAVSLEGELIWSVAIGWADVERGIAATTRTRFRIGSTSKALTATGLARLVDRGLIGLDAPIDEYFDPPNPLWRRMTPRQLASHTAGLPGYGENTDWIGLYRSVRLRDQYDDVMDALEVFDGSDLLFEPGTTTSYSSYGWVLVSAIIERAAGVASDQFMMNEVFLPAGMSKTRPAGGGDGS